ncbi:DUF732 domain-containing protein [Rhodococcus tibetensis]|uniref:DUF732 domain-containing protein n=1 Tax=Rhodococcus tibetensis TaxID=2965064 RepID=A0ABT1QA91_9NOCA|nr:DUF732 domain-containing protein [Rhodococcus sp. FXJ9.536]MCQ4119167.1 DUF732 domain-containing protein [Rhodococcus sp. FXJ9.536]
MTLSACSQATAADDASASAAATTATPSHLDARGLRYQQTLIDAGIPAMPADTVIAIANGICGQLSRGTDEATIMTHLMPMAQFASAAADTHLTTEQVARVYLGAAEANYC